MKQNHLIILALTCLIGAYTAFFTLQLSLHYDSFGSRALDLGNMGQAIWNSSQGRWFHQTNQPGANNRLSLHVEPILIPISWLYLLYSSPKTLFLIQSFVVALGVLPMFALARHKLGTVAWGFIFAVIYLMFPAIQAATLLDFHAVTLAPTFLLAAFYFLETNQPKGFALAAILAVACKEDMTLLVLMLGFYALLIKRNYRWGGITLALCLLWAAIAVFVIPPMFARTDNIHWGRYYHLGSSPSQIVLNMVLQPQLFGQYLIKIQAIHYFSLLLQPTAFIALLNPVTLLLALPSFGINLFSDFPAMHEVNRLIYAAPTVPAVLISSVYGVFNLREGLQWLWSRVRPLPARFEIYFNGGMGLLLLLTSLNYHLHYGYLPGGGQYRGWEEVTAHHRRAAQVIAQIPPEAKLSAQDRLNPHASHRQTLYIFDRIEDANHILLDITEDSWPLHPVALRDKVFDLLHGEFKVAVALDGYLLLAKQSSGTTSLPDPFFDFARAELPIQPQFPTDITFGDKLQLLGYDLTLGAHEDLLPQVTLYWRALKPLDKDYSVWPFFINRQGQRIEDPTERPLVTTLWYPTSRWSHDEIIMTRTLPRDLGDEFTLAIGVTHDNWAETKERLPVTHITDNLYLFEQKTWVRLNTFQRLSRKLYQPLESPLNPPTRPMSAEFWDLIQLQGADLPATPLAPGQPLAFTLHWQTTAPLTLDLTTFAHLINEQGDLVAQLDWQPQDALGYLPTTAWKPLHTVIDRQIMPLKPLPSGQYRLMVGWYYALTGQRLPVTSASGGEEVEVGMIEIK